MAANDKWHYEQKLRLTIAANKAVADSRFLLEMAVRSLFPKIRSMTAATLMLARQLKVDGDLENSKLSDEAYEWVKQLTGQDTVSRQFNESVCNEVKDIYHGLSMDAHFRDGRAGWYIAGEKLPTLVAVAMMVLEAQKSDAFPTDIPPIFFCSLDGKIRFQLKGSKLLDPPPRDE
mmetsp:Transcript_18054/g.72314  ORF Transcript_18054/g.72314 Transcript_18054/m.72314 type:complete len:175 (-) Transcript_18054:105-629(-)